MYLGSFCTITIVGYMYSYTIIVISILCNDMLYFLRTLYSFVGSFLFMVVGAIYINTAHRVIHVVVNEQSLALDNSIILLGGLSIITGLAFFAIACIFFVVQPVETANAIEREEKTAHKLRKPERQSKKFQDELQQVRELKEEATQHEKVSQPEN